MKIYPIIFALVLFASLFLFTKNIMSAIISPSNPNIKYHGRFDFTNPEAPMFNWSGSAISAKFTGTSIGIQLKDGQADYDVWIDGEHHSVIITENSVTEYNIATDLPTDRDHIIKLSRRSEDHFTKVEFLGFVVGESDILLPLPNENKPRIEFIGDSYTVGYGNESDTRTCSSEDLRHKTNTNISFTSLVGEALNAEYTVLGWSGKGMVRNYGDANPTSADPYPATYDNILGAYESPWDYEKNIPDLVVICLGTNDFSTEPMPSEAVYTEAYKNFVARVKGNYPNAKILCVATHVGPNPGYVKTVVEESQQNFPGDVYYSEFPQNGLDMMGCDWHPSAKDDSLIAEAILADIEKIENWKPTSIHQTGKKQGLFTIPGHQKKNSNWLTPKYLFRNKNNEVRRTNSLGIVD